MGAICAGDGGANEDTNPAPDLKCVLEELHDPSNGVWVFVACEESRDGVHEGGRRGEHSPHHAFPGKVVGEELSDTGRRGEVGKERLDEIEIPKQWVTRQIRNVQSVFRVQAEAPETQVQHQWAVIQQVLVRDVV